jgi:Fur family peroxide stress response transcriptional regulator
MTIERASSTALPRLTRQRQAVLDAVRQAPGHPDACGVYDQVRQRIPNISLGTVYRSLAVLRDGGLIRELPQGGGPTRYDANTSDHQHIVCQECGRVLDLDVGDLTALRELAARISRFAEVVGERVEFYGRCQECANKAR